MDARYLHWAIELAHQRERHHILRTTKKPPLSMVFPPLFSLIFTIVPILCHTGVFECLEGERNPRLLVLWNSAPRDGIKWSTETDIHFRVRSVLENLIDILEFSSELGCVNELSVFQLRPDIWTVRTVNGNHSLCILFANI